MNQTDKALKCFETAKQIDKNRSEAYFNIANIYLQNEKYNKALFFAKKSNNIAQNDSTYLFLARAYQNIENNDEAISIYKKITDLKIKNSYDFYSSLGFCYFKKNNYKEAKYYYELALDTNEEDIQSLAGLLAIYIKTKDKIKIDEVTNKLLNMKSKDYNSSFLVAQAYLLNQIYDKALLYLTIAEEEAPYDYRIYNCLGYLYYKKENYLKAMEYFLKAKKLDTKKIVTVYYIALTEYKLGNKTRAQELYHKLKDFDSFWSDKYQSKIKEDSKA